MRPTTRAAIAFVPVAVLLAGVTLDRATADSTVPNVPDGKGSTYQRATVPARVFAVVNANGTKLRGRAVASVDKLGTGIYDVRFNRNISTCAWTGTVGLGTFSGSTGPAEITITGRAGTNNGLFVTTFNGTGTATDEPFITTVICS
jgi:hypothetical protein